jgi:GntR family transcriptional regulator, sialic acid-inducible nan operon repressor
MLRLDSRSLTAILATGLMTVKHDGMKGTMVESLTIDRKKLFEQVAAHLERQILEGKLRPGDQLPPERDLQARFGVGRPAIREALITLQRSGLVEIANGTRARVSMPTASAVVSGMGSAVRQMLSSGDGQRHFQGVRFFFETGLARAAARDATNEDVTRLEAALAANKAAIGNRPRFVATDVAFHFVLAEMTGNPIFAALHDAMSGWLTEQRVVTLEAPGQDRTAYEAHVRIFEAIAAHDPDRAEAAMATHLRQLSDTYWKRQEGSGLE